MQCLSYQNTSYAGGANVRAHDREIVIKPVDKK